MNNFTQYVTTNRKLENFLYLHKVDFISQHKTDDGLTAWVYERTPEFERALDEYKLLYTI